MDSQGFHRDKRRNRRPAETPGSDPEAIHAAVMKYLILVLSAVLLTSGQPEYDSYQGYHGPPAPLGHDGRVVDTPEVARAKAAHLAALKEAHTKAAYGGHSYHGSGSQESGGGFYSPLMHSGMYRGLADSGYYSGEVYSNDNPYHGPPAPLDHEGRVVDTPEVAKAKAAHFAAYNHLASKVPHGPSSASDESYSGSYEELDRKYDYHGPPAPLDRDGRVVDTPEVAHAKAAHLSAYSSTFHEQPHYKDYSTTY